MSGLREAVDGVLAVVMGVVEELVADEVLVDLVGAVRDDHVVDALVGGPGDLSVGADEVEILRVGSCQYSLAELLGVLTDEISDNSVAADMVTS